MDDRMGACGRRVTLFSARHPKSSAPHTMTLSRPLYITVILGTVREGRMSLHPARLVERELAKRPDVETELIDIAGISLPTDDAGEAGSRLLANIRALL